MFIKVLFKKYSVNLLISFVLCVVVIALRLETNPLNILFIILGSLLGTFLLDLEYLIFALVIEPQHHFSQRVRELITAKSYEGALLYIDHHKKAIPRLTLNSALFQVVLAVVVIYILTSSASVVGQVFVLSGFLQSIYKPVDEYIKTKNVDYWFWILKEKPSSRFLKAYFGVLIAVFIYALLLVR